jgi:23S rRNA pseudouridine955/2504/2580 synthase
MKEIMISENEAGQRLDKFLAKYMDQAPKGFFYKMLRKKNITLNGHRAAGNEILAENDSLKLFLSDETMEKFNGRKEERQYSGKELSVLYEDSDILLLNKPAGMLTQKSSQKEDSAAEYLVSRMLRDGSLKKEELRTFRPSPCNRLDRNTSGMVLCGKSLAGLQFLSEMIRDRKVRKTYLAAVAGNFEKAFEEKVYFTKDASKNRVLITDSQTPESEEMITAFEPVFHRDDCSLLKAELITGKPHQIRAHLSYRNYPVLGDPKYGDPGINREMKERYGLTRQMLHSWRIEFPELSGRWSYLSGKHFTAPPPQDFLSLLKALGFKEFHD